MLDTNVLLADPDAIYAYADAEIVIPETVLSELDKLKTSRVDPDLRFRGRQISRSLFELSEGGRLLTGIELPDGARLRVVPLDGDIELPEGLSARNADDRILAVAYQVCSAGCEDLVIVTNDLNMLLKAQTLGMNVERHEGGPEGSWGRRFIVRPVQRYKTPLTILAIAVAVFIAIVLVALWSLRASPTQLSALPSEFRESMTAEQIKLYDLIATLERDDGDLEARLELANLYFDLRDRTGDIEFANKAIKHYERYLEGDPDDVSARADYAAVLFYSGQTDPAIQQAGKVIEQEPDHVKANFNLGIFYWKGRGDLQTAIAEFKKVEELTRVGDPVTLGINAEAKNNIEEIRREAQQRGIKLDETDATGA